MSARDDHCPTAPCACHWRNGYCRHRAKEWGIDVNDLLHEVCWDCGKTWMYGRISRPRAAAVRRALAAGLDWDAYDAGADS